MISDTITQKIGEAMKARDEIRLSTLRMLSSALNYEHIAKQHDLSDEEEITVVRREVKKRNDTIEALKSARGKSSSSTPEELEDKIKKEETELSILKEYLPPEMDENELMKLVDDAIKETGASGMSDMGRVIGSVKAKTAGKAEGGKIAELVKKTLGNSS